MKIKSETFIHSNMLKWENAGEGMRRQIMGYDGQIMMVKVEFQSGAVGAMHSHYHSQSSYIASGLYDVIVEGKVQRLAAGDGFYVEPDQEHSVVCIDGGVVIDVFTPMRADFLK